MTDISTYTDRVLSDEVVVGKWIRLQVQRSVDDLERVGDPDFPFYFDERKASNAVDFFEHLLKH